MLRQLTNLWRYGRLRSSFPTPRSHLPTFLKKNSNLLVDNLLPYLVAPQMARRGTAFFFIQIGAFDGRAGDPLYDLVHHHHWRGLLIEPQYAAFSQLQKNYSQRPGLQFFNVAIGPQDGELTLYSRREGAVSIASTERHRLYKPGDNADDIVAHRVPCWTMATLLRNAGCPPQVDLLQIDAEGFDLEIIRSIDFNACRPSILRYEHKILSSSERNTCLQILAEAGYAFVMEDADTTAILTPQAVQAAMAA